MHDGDAEGPTVGPRGEANTAVGRAEEWVKLDRTSNRLGKSPKGRERERNINFTVGSPYKT